MDGKSLMRFVLAKLPVLSISHADIILSKKGRTVVPL